MYYIFYSFLFYFFTGIIAHDYEIYKHSTLSIDQTCVAIKKNDGTYDLGIVTDKIYKTLFKEKVTFNYQQDKKNPLTNRKVLHLLSLYNRPIVIFEDEPDRIYYILSTENNNKPMHVISSDALMVRQGEKHIPGTIIQIINAGFEIKPGEYEYWYFAVVKPRDGIWGDPGSYICALKIDYELVDKKEEAPASDLDAENIPEKQKEKKFFFKLISQAGIDQLKEAAGITDAVTFLPAGINAAWDFNFERLYISFGLQVHKELNHPVNTLLVGRLKNKQELIVEPIIERSLLKDKHYSYLGINHVGSVNNFSPQIFYSSTSLSYIICEQYDLTHDTTSLKSYPLVNRADVRKKKDEHDAAHGKIASEHQKAEERFYATESGSRFQNKFLRDLAHETQAEYNDFIIGGIIPGKIAKLWTALDTVCIATFNKDHTFSGVYSAQAIFDQQGFIIDWAHWQPAPGFSTGFVEVVHYPKDLRLAYIEEDQGKFIPKTTDWYTYNKKTINQKEKNIYVDLITTLPSNEIQGLWYLSDEHRWYMLVCDTKRAVLGMQEGNEYYITNLHESIIKDLKFLTHTSIYNHDSYSWLLIGGMQGVYIFSDSEGKGLSCSQPLKDVHNSLAHFSCKKILSTSTVKKIIVQQDDLYVLTRNELYHGKLTPAVLAGKEQCNIHQLVSTKEIPGKFNTIEIFGKELLIASTQGLYHYSLAHETWYKVDHSPNLKHMQGFWLVPGAHKKYAQLFVLALSDDFNAQVFRFFIDTQHHQVLQIIDHGFKNIISNYLMYSSGRNFYANDGILQLSTRGGKQPAIHILPIFQAGKQLLSNKGYFVSVEWAASNAVAGIIRNTKTGDWIIGGDFGISVYK